MQGKLEDNQLEQQKMSQLEPNYTNHTRYLQ